MSLYSSFICGLDDEDETRLFSTSPLVYIDIESIIESQEEDDKSHDEKYIEIIKLKYSLVLKDIIIIGLQKKMKEYEWGNKMWNDFTRSFLY